MKKPTEPGLFGGTDIGDPLARVDQEASPWREKPSPPKAAPFEDVDSQTGWTLDYLLRHDHITPMTALREGGILRLAARIKDLRRRGYPLRTEMVKENGKRFARYWWDG